MIDMKRSRQPLHTRFSGPASFETLFLSAWWKKTNELPLGKYSEQAVRWAYGSYQMKSANKYPLKHRESQAPILS